jgi:uncharacterized protein (DUF427 family)
MRKYRAVLACSSPAMFALTPKGDIMRRQQRVEPGPGQESVWDYPRPPRVEPSGRRVEVVLDGELLAATSRALRVLETSHPPVWYLPPEDVRLDLLTPSRRPSTYCEFKGEAIYYDAGGLAGVAWSYPSPSPGYEQLTDYLAFYPDKVDRATVDGEVVQAQAGDFYGGWVTAEVVGPFKGGPGTAGW